MSHVVAKMQDMVKVLKERIYDGTFELALINRQGLRPLIFSK